jgi:glycosyltransferase involved in cell wall biosynthesis
MMMRHAGIPAETPPTYLVGCDAKSDERVFSGSTYHLALQGVQDGLLAEMVNLFPRGLGSWGTYARAAWWKLRGGIHGRHGFKFTDEFLDAVWSRHLPALRGSTIINNFQVFGSHFLRLHREFGITPHVYIDGTLGEYFDNYRAFDTANIDESAKSGALVAERDSYAVCNKIVTMSNRSAVHLVQHYEVPRAKIHVVLPGANIPERFLYGLDRKLLRPRGSKGKSLTLGFIGLYPQRKGLPTIAGAVRLLRRTGYDIRLHLIGRCPAEIAQQDGVSYLGLIDKRIDIDRFIEVISNVDIGCMLSRAELAGVALLEFLRMGVPVIGTDVGGIPDIVELGAGLVVAPEIQTGELAEQLARIIDQPDRLIELQEAAWQRRHHASWRRAVQELKSVLAS